MKRWRRWTAIRALVYLVCLALVVPYFPAPVFAGETLRVKVAVAEFNGDLGKSLAEATRIALSQSSRLEPTKELAPAGKALQSGQWLGADIVLTGTVTPGKGHRSEATVDLKAEAIQVQTGKTIARFYVRGSSGNKVGYQGDRKALVQQAINDAALNLSQEVSTSLTVSGVVMMVREDSVLISLGKRDNIRVGAEVAVLHGDEEIATLVVTEVDTANSRAKVSSGDIKQISTNDKIRLKYNPPQPVKQIKKGNNGMAVLGVILLAALVLGSRGGGKGGGGETLPPGTSKQYNIDLAPSATSIVADGKSTATIDVTVRDKQNNLVPDGTVVQFTTTLGFITASATTKNGKAQATLTSATVPGTANVKATVGPDFKSLNIQLVATGAYIIQLLPSSTSIVADGKSKVIIDITVTDAQNHLVPDGTVVKFDTTLGAIAAQGLTTDGKVQAVLTSGTTPGTAIFKVTVGTTSQTLEIQFMPVTPPGEPASIKIEPSAPSVLADGKSTVNIVITVLDSQNRPVPDGTVVRLGTTLGSIAPAQANTLNGQVQAVLTSGNASGTAMITASAGSINQIANIEFIAATPAVIEMSANPQIIQVTQTGGPELATITATVRDVRGNPIATQTTVVFSILGAPNGAVLTRTEVGTENGSATTELKSGQVSGTARIQAVVKGNSAIAAAQTSVIIKAGPPFYLDFGITPLNIAGLVYVNESATVSGFVSDVYKNPVPDNTAVYFTTDSGMIEGSALTKDGFVTVHIFSGDPHPALPNLVEITAKTRKQDGSDLIKQHKMLWSGPTADIVTSTDTFNLKNGESTSMTITVGDIFGNPIVGGSSIAVSSKGVNIDGDITVSVQDTATPGAVSVLNIVLNDPDPKEINPQAATITIKVTSRNGNKSLTIRGTTE